MLYKKNNFNSLNMTTNSLFERYDISDWGFLSDPYTNILPLPSQFEEYSEVIELINSNDGHLFRNAVNKLEKGLDKSYYTSKLNGLTNSDFKRIYLIFTFIAQKYTKCLDNKIDTIPYEIGLIWYYSAKELGLPTVLTYAASILYNCKFDENGKLKTIYSMSGTPDELHFYEVHITLENTCGKLLKHLISYIEFQSEQNLLELLISVKMTLEKITEILRTMYDNCKPEKFWTQVRLYLSGFTSDNGFPNGLKIKDTDISFSFGGGSAAQSSLIQLIDVILEIAHESEHGKQFLADQRNYMPKKHRDFLQYVETHFQKKSLRLDVTKHPNLLSNYNDAISALKIFRQARYRLVHDYVVKFVKQPEEEVGVGGLMFKELVQYIKDTKNSEFKKNLNSSNKVSTNNWWLWLVGIGIIAYCISKISN